MEATEYTIKIREQKIVDEFSQNLESIRTSNLMERQQEEVQKKLKSVNNSECRNNNTKNMRVQCNIENSRESKIAMS
jgi:hypothetical protein